MYYYDYYYDDQSFDINQFPQFPPRPDRALAQRVAALEATVRQQNQRINDLERRVFRLERRVLGVREEGEV